MYHFYRVFGLTCKSEIGLPALLESSEIENFDFEVKLVKSLPEFQNPTLASEEGCRYNENEFFLEVEDVAKYMVRNGKEIFIITLSEDWNSTLLFFYSNCLGALLFQRNLIPFHVSGIIDKEGKVWLFAAPSQTGKSTTALKLKEKGYEIFTDDTALIYVREGKCWSIPSYPMIRAWKNTLDKQSVFQPEEATQIRSEIDKYGIFFHKHFQDMPREVKGVIFLEEQGQEIQIRKIGGMEALPFLGNNIYRGYWVEGMKKQIIQFEVLTSIVRYTNFWNAIRPKNQDSFNSFTDEIIDKILVKG